MPPKQTTATSNGPPHIRPYQTFKQTKLHWTNANANPNKLLSQGRPDAPTIPSAPHPDPDPYASPCHHKDDHDQLDQESRHDVPPAKRPKIIITTPRKGANALMSTPATSIRPTDSPTEIIPWPKDRQQTIEMLRAFDLNGKFGPCVGLSRFERWERAKKFGMNPPESLGKFLSSDIVENDIELSQNLWYDSQI
ncbi:hypothetical protein SeLEV6574_g06976 [Synchytrium endobioticum]|uniref:DNA polymerase delta subunit 4 n=1 Tax=Synchytrium endobioticum TaxID=286115 RepID=A0A507CJG1_9FUNG|nr:hypothetical protein SeLEV6574_g06976 [Synchytrium endobioticum]